MMQNLPRIPAAEYRQRWEKVQQVLRDEALDMLLVYADDRHTYGAAYARYYGNLPVAFEPVLLLFTPGRDTCCSRARRPSVTLPRWARFPTSACCASLPPRMRTIPSPDSNP